MTQPPRFSQIAAIFAVFTILGIALVLAQPSLTPPAGPIDETARFGVLIELNDTTAPPDALYEHVITQPGSYYLTADVIGGPGGPLQGEGGGVLILVDDVTLDLNGFALRGTGLSSIGVSVANADGADTETERITVRNGRIVGFAVGVRGVSFGTNEQGAQIASRLSGLHLDGLHVDAQSTGIDVSGARVINCAITSPRTGIRAFFSIVEGCEIRMRGEPILNLATGMTVQQSNITRCHVDTTGSDASTRNGFIGVDSLFTACTARDGANGFNLVGTSIANGCLAINVTGNSVSATSQTNDSNF